MALSAIHWFDPPAPPDTASPSDREPMDPHANDVSTLYMGEWLSYQLDLEAREPDGQFQLYSADLSITTFLDGAAALHDSTDLALDIPAPPPEQQVAQQQADFLSQFGDLLPGAG